MPRKGPALKSRIRRFLRERKMTQQDLAACVGISRGHMSTIVSRRATPSLQLAVSLETVTGIPARDFRIHR